MNAKTMLVALLSASMMLACAAEGEPETSADEPVDVRVQMGDGENADAKGEPSGGVTPKVAAARGWCVYGYNRFTEVNWSYCCFSDGCEYWSQ